MTRSWLPARCTACGAPGGALCGACLAGCEPAPPLAVPAGLDWCVALVAHQGSGRSLVAGLKFANRRGALAVLAPALADLVPRAAAGGEAGIDVVTWAPTTPARRRRRGYDQAELLARAVAPHLGRPAHRLLARAPGPSLTGRSRADRAGAAQFRATRAVPARVVVVDDVRTTGTTLGVAARALRSAGAATVGGLVVAATPPGASDASRRPTARGAPVD